MSKEVNFVDNYIKYLIHKYIISTRENDNVDLEVLKSLLKNKHNIAFDKIKNTDKCMIDLTKQISKEVFVYKICDKTKVDLDEKIYLHYKLYF